MIISPNFALRQRKPLLTTFILLSILFFFKFRDTHYFEYYTSPSTLYHSFGHGSPADAPSLAGHRSFWYTFGPILEKHKPACGPPTRLNNVDSVRFDHNDDTYSRPEALSISKADLEILSSAHAGFIKDILSETSNVGLFYIPGTRGIVSTAGGRYLPTLVATMRLLRRTGSKLPVEVFMTSNEYDSDICEVVFPRLNARCVTLDEIFIAAPPKTKISQYQYKAFALLFSSFEDILFLDADIFPVRDPSYLFNSEPYLSRHLITWPDFWFSSTSPLFYSDIIHRPMPKPSIRASTESGAIVISRSNRGTQSALMLAAYYNYHGPDYYYPLLSQGALGEGDKETFLSAALALDIPFYSVQQTIGTVGRWMNEGPAESPEPVYHGYGMVQYDPVAEYASLDETDLDGSAQTSTSTSHGSKPEYTPKPLFLHAHHPKPNAALIFASSGDKAYINPSTGKDERMWGDVNDNIRAFGFDIEKALWEEVRWVSCWEFEEESLGMEGSGGVERKSEEGGGGGGKRQRRARMRIERGDIVAGGILGKREAGIEEGGDACARVKRYMANVFGDE